MKLKQFMEMYDNWNGITKINDDNLDTIVKGRTLNIMEYVENFHPMTKVKNYKELMEMEVVSFGFYDEEFCVRVKEKHQEVVAMKNILTKELKEEIVKEVSLLKEEWDAVGIKLNEDKGLFIQVERHISYGKAYFIELNDIYGENGEWNPCATHNPCSLFGDMDGLIRTIEYYLKEEL